jgi:DNA-binding CsgD family transcriptional regulator
VSRSAQVEAEVIRQCRRGLDVAGVQREVLRVLRRAVPVDAAFFATADPETLLFTGAHAEEPLATATQQFLANEFDGADVNRFAALATAPVHVRTLDAATRGERAASARYNEIMRPIGLGDELRAALVAGGFCWGYLCLHREDDPLGFTSAEAALVARISPHVAHALRQSLLLHRPTARGNSRPGVVLLDDRLEMVATTPEAEELLALVVGGGSAWPPLAVLGVAAPLVHGADAILPSTHVQARDGRWLNLHASWMEGPPGARLISVVVERAEPRTSLGIVLAAHGLTPREQEVTRLVLRGASTAAVCDALHISRYTVQDHMTAVFDKAGVRSRRDLVGLLLGAHIGDQ